MIALTERLHLANAVFGGGTSVSIGGASGGSSGGSSSGGSSFYAHTLYESAVGTASGVSLEGPASNFAYLDIEVSYPDGVVAATERVYSPNGRTVDIAAVNVVNGGVDLSRVRYFISDSLMAMRSNVLATLSNGAWTYSTNNLLCTRVIGYTDEPAGGDEPGSDEPGSGADEPDVLGSGTLGSMALGSS